MKKILNTYIAPPLLFLLMYAISLTLRVREVGKEKERKLEADGAPIIYVFWHGRLFFCPYYFRTRSTRPASEYSILVSPSVDGEIIARVLSMFGYGVIRGSSFKSARKGLRELVRSVDEGNCAVLIADGSRGPAERLQPGSLMLSKLTGRTVIPLTMSFSSRWTLGSWDRMMIPKPFSEVVVVYGDPAFVPAGAGAEGLERKRQELEVTLRSITKQADGYFEGK